MIEHRFAIQRNIWYNNIKNSEVYIMAEGKDKQSEIYEFLKTYTENKGYPPSVREICEAVS